MRELNVLKSFDKMMVMLKPYLVDMASFTNLSNKLLMNKTR